MKPILQKLEETHEAVMNLTFKHQHQYKSFDKHQASEILAMLKRMVARNVIQVQVSTDEIKNPLFKSLQESGISVSRQGLYTNILLA